MYSISHADMITTVVVMCGKQRGMRFHVHHHAVGAVLSHSCMRYRGT